MTKARHNPFTHSTRPHSRRGLGIILCGALLATALAAPTHAQQANGPALMIATAPAQNSKQGEAALKLNRTQRVWVQEGLNALRFDVGTTDGIFGARTRAAIARWQSARGESPTGYLNAEAAEVLIVIGKAEGPVKPPAAPAAASTKQSPNEATAKTAEAVPSKPQRVVAEETLNTLNQASLAARSMSDPTKVLSEIARAQVAAGDTEGAKRTISEALSSARSITEGWHRAMALGNIAQAQAVAGDTQSATRSSSEALSIAASVKDDWRRTSALIAIAPAQAASGDIQGAMATARSTADRFAHTLALVRIAQAQVNANETESAKRTISEALSIGRRVDNDTLRVTVLSGIAIAQIEAGDTKGAKRSFSEAQSTTQRITNTSHRDSALIGIVKAQAALGDSQGALSTMRRITDANYRTWALPALGQGQAAAGDIQGAQSTARSISDDGARALTLTHIARAQLRAPAKPAPTQTASTGSGATSTAAGAKPASTGSGTTSTATGAKPAKATAGGEKSRFPGGQAIATKSDREDDATECVEVHLEPDADPYTDTCNRIVFENRCSEGLVIEFNVNSTIHSYCETPESVALGHKLDTITVDGGTEQFVFDVCKGACYEGAWTQGEEFPCARRVMAHSKIDTTAGFLVCPGNRKAIHGTEIEVGYTARKCPDVTHDGLPTGPRCDVPDFKFRRW